MVRIEIDIMTNKKIYYACPYCWKLGNSRRATNRYKNGTIIKSARPTTHSHSNETGHTDMEPGWSTHRSTHCTFDCKSVELVVSDNTIKL